jgi:hypothetical protein
MYCPKCGQSDQAAETFCRRCGLFLPDLSKPVKTANTPQDHVTANTVLSSMTIAVCLVLAFLLYLMLAFRPETHPLIYVTSGLLIAMAAWHVQTLWRSLLLRKHFKKQEQMRKESLEAGAPKLIMEQNLDDFVPASVTERTTRDLTGSRRGSSPQAHH